MLDHEDLKWIATTSTELNSMLQQISRYADLARQHKGEYNYIEMLGERVEIASKTAQSLFDRITSRILEGSASKAANTPNPARPPEFRVVRPAAEEAASQKNKTAADKSPNRPKAPPAENKKSQPKSGAIPAEIDVLNRKGNRELILLVDDEVSICEITKAALENYGYRVLVANSGPEAVTFCAEKGNDIKLVITDTSMPFMDGNATSLALKKIRPELKIIMASGEEPAGNKRPQPEVTIDAFAPKPYTVEKLLTVVHEVLQRKA